jgi:hypothetical protein
LLEQRAQEDAAQHALQQSLVELELTKQELEKTKIELQKASQGVGSVRALIRGLGIPFQVGPFGTPSNDLTQEVPHSPSYNDLSLSESDSEPDESETAAAEPDVEPR